MQIDVSFKHMDASDALRAYAVEKTEKFKKYFDGKLHVTWNFSAEKQGHVAHCHVLGDHMDYFGDTAAETAYAAVDLTVEKIEKQIRKHKEVVKDHLHRAR